MRRGQLDAWLLDPERLPGGPRGLLVKVKPHKGSAGDSEYVVAQIVEADAARAQLRLKAADGALNQVPGQPCWYPCGYVSNAEMRREDAMQAALYVQTGVFAPATVGHVRALGRALQTLDRLSGLATTAAAEPRSHEPRDSKILYSLLIDPPTRLPYMYCLALDPHNIISLWLRYTRCK